MIRTDGSITKLAAMFNLLDREQTISGIRTIEEYEKKLEAQMEKEEEIER